MSEEYCKHCGSERHLSKNCPILHLTNYMLGKDEYDPDLLPDVVVAVDEEDLFDAIDEAHAIQHLKPVDKHRSRTR